MLSESGFAGQRGGSPTPSTATSSSATTLSRRERLQSHMLTSLLSLQSIPPPNRLPVSKNKESLSLPTTTRNFRGFVQKSGPVFAIQDAVHETLMWDYPPRTLCVMAAWAIIALHPNLLVPLPTFLLSLLLLQTYQARYPSSSVDSATPGPTPAQVIDHALSEPTSTGHGKVRPPVVPEPPNEGSVKYYENLRDIQNMMKMITDAYDLLAPLSIHLNWSSPTHTLLLFQSLILVTLLLFFISPYLPYRFILLLVGEGVFILNHPWTEPVVKKLLGKIWEGKEGRKLKESNRKLLAMVNEWVKMDQLPDEVWQRGWREVEVFENERFALEKGAKAKVGEGRWSGHNLRYGERKPWTKGADGYADDAALSEGYTLDVSRQIAMSLEDGWSWIDGDDWRIDFLGLWSPLGVDEAGWLYSDSDWHKGSPYPFGHQGQPLLPPTTAAPCSASCTGSVLEGEEEEQAEDGAEVDADGLPHDLPTAHSKEGHVKKAATRRRRWLRRAVWIGVRARNV